MASMVGKQPEIFDIEKHNSNQILMMKRDLLDDEIRSARKHLDGLLKERETIVFLLNKRG